MPRGGPSHIAHVQNVGNNGTTVLTMLPSPTVRIVICGNADGGDDGVALSAAATVLPSLPRQVRRCLEVRRRQQLRVDDLVTGFQLENGGRWARPVGVAIGPDGALYFTSDSETDGLFRLRRKNK